MFTDMPLDQLKTYMPPRNEPGDFDTFWQRTLAEVRRTPLNPKFEAVDYGLRTVETFDVTFSGYGGEPIKGGGFFPKQRSGKVAGVGEIFWYCGGAGCL